MAARTPFKAKVSRRRSRSSRRAGKAGLRPIWEEVLRIAKAIPDPALHKLPTDLAAHHDHYLYGGHGA